MLGSVAVLALAAFALVRLTRKLVPRSWVEHPPAGCDVCWSTWMALAVVGAGKIAGLVVASTAGWPVVWLATAGGALLLTEASGALRPAIGPPLPRDAPLP